MYLMPIIKFPKWAINTTNSQMSHFLWANLDNKHKYHLTTWDLVCHKKEYGGLGVHDLRDFNLCLLASWVKRYNMADHKIWKQIVDYKYDTTSPNGLLPRMLLLSGRALFGQ
uniref:Uncharacterized protein n=1 Tax=Avena sativa TaxID=4498 RepID=A0ACD5Y6E5_AVESA